MATLGAHENVCNLQTQSTLGTYYRGLDVLPAVTSPLTQSGDDILSQCVSTRYQDLVLSTVRADSIQEAEMQAGLSTDDREELEALLNPFAKIADLVTHQVVDGNQSTSNLPFYVSYIRTCPGHIAIVYNEGTHLFLCDATNMHNIQSSMDRASVLRALHELRDNTSTDILGVLIHRSSGSIADVAFFYNHDVLYLSSLSSTGMCTFWMWSESNQKWIFHSTKMLSNPTVARVIDRYNIDIQQRHEDLQMLHDVLTLQIEQSTTYPEQMTVSLEELRTCLQIVKEIVLPEQVVLHLVPMQVSCFVPSVIYDQKGAKTTCPVMMQYLHQYLAYKQTNIPTNSAVTAEQCFHSMEDIQKQLYLLLRPTLSLPQACVSIAFTLCHLNGMQHTLDINTVLPILEEPIFQQTGILWEEYLQVWKTYRLGNIQISGKYDILPKLQCYHLEGCTILLLQGQGEPLRVMYVKHIDIISNLFQHQLLMDNAVYLPTLPLLQTGRLLVLVDYTDTLRQILSLTLGCTQDVLLTMEKDRDLSLGKAKSPSNGMEVTDFSILDIVPVCFTLSLRNNLIMACCNRVFNIQIEHNVIPSNMTIEHAFYNTSIHAPVYTCPGPVNMYTNVLGKVIPTCTICTQCNGKYYVKTQNKCISCHLSAISLDNLIQPVIQCTPNCVDISVKPLYEFKTRQTSIDQIHIYNNILITVSPFHVSELTKCLPPSVIHWYQKQYPGQIPDLRSLLLLPTTLNVIHFHSLFTGACVGSVYSINQQQPLAPHNQHPLLSHTSQVVTLQYMTSNPTKEHSVNIMLLPTRICPPYSLPVLYNSTSLGFLKCDEAEVNTSNTNDIMDIMKTVLQEKYQIPKKNELWLATEYQLGQLHPDILPVFAEYVFQNPNISQLPYHKPFSSVSSDQWSILTTSLRLLLLLSPGTSDIPFPSLTKCDIPFIVPRIEQKRVFDTTEQRYAGTAMEKETPKLISLDKMLDSIMQGFSLLFDHQSISKLVNNTPSMTQIVSNTSTLAELKQPLSSLAFRMTAMLTSNQHTCTSDSLRSTVDLVCQQDIQTQQEFSSLLFSLFSLPNFHSLRYNELVPEQQSDAKHGIITYPLLTQSVSSILARIDTKSDMTLAQKLPKCFINPMSLPFLERLDQLKKVYIDKQKLSEFDLFVSFLAKATSHNTLLFVRLVEEYFSTNATNLRDLPVYVNPAVDSMQRYIRTSFAGYHAYATQQIENLVSKPQYMKYGIETKETQLDLPGNALFQDLVEQVEQFIGCREAQKEAFENVHVPLNWVDDKIHENDVILSTQSIYEQIYKAGETLQLSREDWCAKQALFHANASNTSNTNHPSKVSEEAAWRGSVEQSRAQDTYEKSTGKLSNTSYQRGYDFLESEYLGTGLGEQIMEHLLQTCTVYISTQNPTPWDILQSMCTPIEGQPALFERNTNMYVQRQIRIPDVARLDVKELNTRVDQLIAQGDYCRGAYEYIRHMQVYESIVHSLFTKEQSMQKEADTGDVVKSDSLAIILTAQVLCVETLVYLSNHQYSLLLWCYGILGPICVAHECNVRTTTARHQLLRKLLEVSATVTDLCHDAEVDAGVQLDYTAALDIGMDKNQSLESSMSCIFTSLSFVTTNSSSNNNISNVVPNNNIKTPMLTQLNAQAVITQALPVDIVSLDIQDERSEWFCWKLSESKKQHVEYIIQNICIKILGVAKRYGCYTTTSWDLVWNHGLQAGVETTLLPNLQKLCEANTEVKTLLSAYKIQ